MSEQSSELSIAFITASGYGNVGDDTYPLVFQEHLRDCKLEFFNSDDYFGDFKASDYDYVVMGGGGLIYAPNPSITSQARNHHAECHFKNMTWFLDQAISCGVPYGFVSCGVQLFREVDGVWDFSGMEAWHKYFESASLITVRDVGSYEYIKPYNMKTYCVSDLAYLYNPPEETTDLEKQSYIVVCPNEYLAVSDPAIHRMIEKYQSYNYKLAVISMGGNSEDHTHVAKILENFGGTAFYDLTPPRAFHLIKNSSYVISGRYHGLVFARSSGVPCFHQSPTFKTAMENEAVAPDPREAAKQHITLLLQATARTE